MANEDVMAVDERVARLEVTMAKGFLEQGQRLDRLEDRMATLDAKFDVVSESIRGDVTTIRELVTGFMDEMRRTTDSMRKEHEADRRLTRSALFDHVTRIRTLEGGSSGAES
jgi:hypothetical protein